MLYSSRNDVASGFLLLSVGAAAVDRFVLLMTLTLEDRRPETDAVTVLGTAAAAPASTCSASSSSMSSSYASLSSKNSETSASVTPALTLMASLISLANLASWEIERFPVLGCEFASL